MQACAIRAMVCAFVPSSGPAPLAMECASRGCHEEVATPRSKLCSKCFLKMHPTQGEQVVSSALETAAVEYQEDSWEAKRAEAKGEDVACHKEPVAGYDLRRQEMLGDQRGGDEQAWMDSSGIEWLRWCDSRPSKTF